MRKLHYITKNVNVLNCLLLLTVAAIAYAVAIPFLHVKVRTSLPAVRQGTNETAVLPSALPNSSYADYIVMGEQNLFHPERKIPQEKKDEKAALSKLDLILYGTLIMPGTFSR